MALFSFRHSVKTFSPKCEAESRMAVSGQTTAHLRYITRASAARDITRTRLDRSSNAVLGTIAEKAAEKRKGRVCERFIIALPVEATDAQRSALARGFAESLTQGKAGYILAVHDKQGNDRRNPHFHLVAFDQYEANGGRGRPRSVIGMARKKAIETWAKHWADMHNEMMRGWGYSADSNITHESFATQGIDRIPEIHEGSGARHLSSRSAPLKSKPQWKRIDAGKTRASANIIIREINQLKEQQEHETGIRLGSRDAGNTHQGDGSSKALGEDRRRGLPDPVRAGKPGSETIRDEQDFDRDRQPPWIAGGSTGEPGPPFARNQGSNATKPISAPPVGPGRANPRAGRVRRVFLELIMLRDTLRARLWRKAAGKPPTEYNAISVMEGLKPIENLPLQTSLRSHKAR